MITLQPFTVIFLRDRKLLIGFGVA